MIHWILSRPPACDWLILQARGAQLSLPLLAHYVDAPEAVQHVLAEVHVVEDWRAALAQRSTLSDGASIVSKDGLWVSKRWIRTRSEADAEQGIIARQARLSGIVEAFDRVAAELSTTDVAISEHQALRSETEQSIDAAQESMQVAQHEASRLDAQKRALLAQREQRQAREAQLHQDRSRFRSARCRRASGDCTSGPDARACKNASGVG